MVGADGVPIKCMEKRKDIRTVKKIVRAYKSLLLERGIPVEKVLLFGSYATGKAKYWSDIDVAVVSKKFKNYEFDEETHLRGIALDLSDDIEPHVFRRSDFTGAYVDPLASQVAKHGLEI